MREMIKKGLPDFMYQGLVTARAKLHKPVDFVLIKTQPRRHAKALNRIKNKSRIKVAFFVLNIDVWKYENLILLLEEDNRFDPEVFICPPTNLMDPDAIQSGMAKAYDYFINRNHSVTLSYDESTHSYLDVKREISPDIIFFTNPYGYTLKNFRIENFLHTLTCYVQYSFIMESRPHFYNNTFHNLLWKAFYETPFHKELAENFAMNNGANVEVTGYPGVDSLVYGKRLDNSAWKNSNTSLKRIIWAPHWSVISRGHERTSASNFIDLSQFMLDAADTYKDKIQIAFKPHPYLKSTLYKQEGWGKERTDSYYHKWDHLENGQLETGNYIDLFNSSDAMILDSMSFIAEYLYCGKPSLFLKSTPEVDKWFNTFGKLALEQHYHGSQQEDVIRFIEQVVIGRDDKLKEKRDQFYHDTLTPPNGRTASENIYESLCREIFS